MQWTNDAIHFIPQRPKDHTANPQQAVLDPCSPYFVFDFGPSTDETTAECCSKGDIGHRYPRILGLGIMIIHLCGKGSRSKPNSSAQSIEEYLNHRFSEAYHVWKSPSWPALDFRGDTVKKTLRSVVKACLDPKLFKVPNQTIFEDHSSSIKKRRLLLFKHVVYPLRKLLADSGLSQELENTKRDEYSASSPYISSETAEYLTAGEYTQRSVTDHAFHPS